MNQEEIGNFNKGKLESSASQRTAFRGARRLKQRQKKRRERLVLALKSLGFIPRDWQPNERYSLAFEQRGDKTIFKFQDSYNAMRAEFLALHPQLRSISHDWVIYYLRKKALSTKITKEELAWILLQFNTKRGYYQLRDDDELKTDEDKYFINSIVDHILDLEDDTRGKKRLEVHLREGIVAQYTSKEIPEWLGQSLDFIVTEKKNKDGSLSVTLSLPKEDDWTLRKKKTESLLENSEMTVGEYIYDKILQSPFIKIRGKEVHTIDRIFYKSELLKILEKQATFHESLADKNILEEIANRLYKRNKAHRTNLIQQGIVHLLVHDIIYYQRPLKSKKYLLSKCKFESYKIKSDGKWTDRTIPVAPKSHPLYQEFRIWDIIHNLKVLAKEHIDENGIIRIDFDVSSDFLGDKEKEILYASFRLKKELSENAVLKVLGLSSKKYTLNYPEKTKFKGHELIASIVSSCKDCPADEISNIIDNEANLEFVWHALYSLNDKTHISKALRKDRLGLHEDTIQALSDMKSFPKEYGAFSVKALKKLLPLMRCGHYWNEHDIDPPTRQRLNHILTAEEDTTINDRVRKILFSKTSIEDFKGLSTSLASYAVYDRHSEVSDIQIHQTPEDIHIENIVKAGSLRNPAAKKVLRETVLIVRDIWKMYGKPSAIHIELAREMKLSNDQREKYTRRRDENFRTNKRAKALLLELKDDGNTAVNPYSRGHLELMKLYEEGAMTEAISDKVINAIVTKDDPTRSEIQRYKLWLEQRYISPYTGNIIPLSDLFTSKYDIEHIIPKSLFFDDSFNNKIICERSINSSKNNRTAYEMICNCQGSINGEKILSKEAYEDLVKSIFFYRNNNKYRKLLQYESSTGFNSSQLNNTRYINRKLMEYLDPFVREEGEIDAISKNILPMPGGITNQLKNDWGLHDKWKEILKPRFERMNEITHSTDYINIEGNKIHLSGYENEVKRLDHRHHALDAIIIACTTRRHIMYKNSMRSEHRRIDLEPVLFHKDAQSKKVYKQPWKGFTMDAYKSLEQIIVSFKYNNRIINKTLNYYQKYVEQADGTWQKKYVQQEANPNHWAIRNAIHQETIYGKLTEKVYKSVPLASALKNIDNIANKSLKKTLKKLFTEYNNDIKLVKKHLKKYPLKLDGDEVSKIDVFSYAEYATSQVSLDDKLKASQIENVVDKSLKLDLLEHLSTYNGDEKLAFSENGVIEFNQKRHHPVKSMTVKQDLGIAKQLGDRIPKTRQFVKGAKGTNLFYAVHEHQQTGALSVSKESTIPFMEVIESMKDDEEFVVQKDDHSYFTLSPGDLVYVFEEGARRVLPSVLDPDRVYKCVSFSKQQCFFMPHRISSVIQDKFELGKLNKLETDLNGIMIKRNCMKININRLGKTDAI